MNLSNMTFWELTKLNYQIQIEGFKRIWWILLIILLVYTLYLFKDEIRNFFKKINK